MDALVSWNVPSDSSVTEHRIYRGIESGNYFAVQVVPMPTTQYQFTQLDDYKRHYFAVTAYNGLESDQSTEVSKRMTHRFNIRQS
jgi:hypothetical protein